MQFAPHLCTGPAASQAVRYAQAGYIGIYGSYGLTSLLDDGEGGSLLTIDPHNSQRIVYGGTFSYGAGGGGTLNLLRVGVKVGVDLGSAVDN